MSFTTFGTDPKLTDGTELSGSVTCTTPTTLTQDRATSDVSTTCTDAAGNQGTASVPVGIDKVAPTITGSRTPGANGNGWNNTDVTASFTCADNTNGSGVASCTAPVILAANGAGQSASGTVADAAGNTVTTSVSDINIDKVAPTASITANGTKGAGDDNHWYRSDVSFTTSGTDALSGGVTCTTPATLTQERVIGGVSTTCTDLAGNEGTASVQVGIDKTLPTITGSRSPVANGNGWNNTDVTASFTCRDGLSGVASCTRPVTLSNNGANQSAEGTVTDGAGNTASTSVTNINIDKVAPTISYALSSDANPAGWHKANVTVSFTCSDNTGGSGFATNACPAPVTVSDEGTTRITGSVSDKAGNSASITPFDIKLDKVAPTIRYVLSTAANQAGWHKANITVSFTCTDNEGGSGFATNACPADITVSDEGTTQITGSVSDKAGNSASITPFDIKLDKVAATASITASGTKGTGDDNYWYRSDVSFTTSGTDPNGANGSVGSGGVTCTTPATLTQERVIGSVSTTCTDLAGNQGTASVQVGIDKTLPTITGSRSPVANGNGWNNTDVTASFACRDGLSGVASCTRPVTLSNNGANQSAEGTVTDGAGNTATISVSNINIDKVAPTISYALSTAANPAGWHKANVTVTFICSDNDGGSGLVDNACPAPITVSAEGNTNITGSVSDKAGNSASITPFDIKLDKTAPTITGSRAPGANSNGWNNTDVIVTFSCTDGGSGVASCTAPVTVSSNGADQSAAGTVTDAAGNTATAAVGGISIDKVAPTTPTFVGGIVDGGKYYFGSVPAQPTCSATDTVSGVKSCVVSDYNTAVGSYTLTATATDAAGNESTATLKYTVLNWTTAGFYQPVEMTPAGGTIVYNTVKAGSTVPLKFNVYAGPTGTNELTDTAIVKTPAVKAVSCTAGTEDALTDLATGGTVLRYDTTAKQFVYNMQLPKTVGCYLVTVTLNDNSTISAYFRTR